MAKQAAAYLIAGTLGLLSVQCGGDQSQEPQAAPAPMPEPMPAEPSMTPAARTTPPAPMAETPPPAAAEPMPAEPAEPERQALSDAQIAAVTAAANDAEIEQAKIAQKNAKHPRVKKFAAMMLKDHTQANQKQKKLLKKLDLAPADNAMSTQLASDSQQKLEDLKSLKGADFDRAYMDAQVDAHQKVLDALDNQLIPETDDAEFKALLDEIRPKIAAHLAEAREIQQTLLDASTGQSSGGQSEKSGVQNDMSGTKSGGTDAPEHRH